MKKMYQVAGCLCIAIAVAYAVMAFVISSTSADGTVDGFGRYLSDAPHGLRIQPVPALVWQVVDWLVIGALVLCVRFCFGKMQPKPVNNIKYVR